MEVIEKQANKVKQYKPGIITKNVPGPKSSLHEVKFELEETNGEVLLYISSPLLDADNFNLMIKGERLTLIISEKKDIDKPFYIHNLQINAFNQTEYERLKSYEFHLPKNDLLIDKTRWIAKERRIEVQLYQTKLF